MKKLKIISIIVFILSVLLCENFVYAEELFHEIEPGDIEETEETKEREEVSRNIFTNILKFPNTEVETDYFNTIDEKALNYDEILYQIIALDFEQAEEVIGFQQEAEEELNKQMEYIDEQKILAQGENPTVTIDEVNNLIDEYNKNYIQKQKEIKERRPTYDENNWKELQNGNQMVFTDTTGKTAYLFIFVKVTDNDFKGEKTKYLSGEYDMNYEYFKKNIDNEASMEGTSNTTTNIIQNQEQKPSEEEQKPTQNNYKNNDKTVSPTKLPKARFDKHYNTSNIYINIKYNFL